MLTTLTSVTSVHSRAAKRASSPGINLDKSVKNIKTPSFIKSLQPSVLAIHQGAGVLKRSNHRKSVPSSKARRRHKRELDFAEKISDKKEKKIERSKNKARAVNERCKSWEELNEILIISKKKRPGDFALGKSTPIDFDPSSNIQNVKDSRDHLDQDSNLTDGVAEITASFPRLSSSANDQENRDDAIL